MKQSEMTNAEYDKFQELAARVGRANPNDWAIIHAIPNSDYMRGYTRGLFNVLFGNSFEGEFEDDPVNTGKLQFVIYREES